jgi:hypothetical protein
MGRKLLIVVAAIGSLALAATPAAARMKVHKVRVHKQHGYLVMSTKASKPHRITRAKARRMTITPAPTPDVVIHGGYNSECTTPTSQNFNTSDTIEATATNNTLVSDCSADLASPNAPKSTTGAALTWNHTTITYATVALCRLYQTGGVFAPSPGFGTVLGSGFTVTYPDGLFVETCTASTSSTI